MDSGIGKDEEFDDRLAAAMCWHLAQLDIRTEDVSGKLKFSGHHGDKE